MGTQVYLYAIGGNPGSGSNNPNAGLLAGLGQCPASGTMAAVTPYVTVNEVTTIAFAYAMAGYSVDATHVGSSGTALAQTGIANAMNNIPNILNVASGLSYTVSKVGSGVVPQSRIYALSNVLAACINSNGGTATDGSACGTLFANVTSNGILCSTAPCANATSDTATAAMYMAKNPWHAPTAAFNLGTAQSPFQPADASDADWAIGVRYAFLGGGGGNALISDASGNMWATVPSPNKIQKYSPLGVTLSFSVTYSLGMAIDSGGTLWASNANTTLTTISPAGVVTVITPTNGGSAVFAQTNGLAFDPSGNLWVTDNTNSNVVKLSSSGTYLGTISGGGLNQPSGLAFDTSANAWVGNYSGTTTQITKVTGTTASAFASIQASAAPFMTATDSSQNIWASATNFSGLLRIAQGATTGTPVALPGITQGIAVDGAGKVFAASKINSPVFYEVSNTGAQITGANGYATTFNTSFTQGDISGNLWVLGASNIEQFLGMSTPVVQPLTPATAGTRP